MPAESRSICCPAAQPRDGSNGDSMMSRLIDLIYTKLGS